MKHSRTPLLFILAAYLLVAAAYAYVTPPWQAPDEPAHYNYVRHLVKEGRPPVLSSGDYPHEYLEELKAAGFPLDMPVSSISYESHQPPLYYFLAAPVLTAVVGDDIATQVLILRLFTITIGLAVVVLTYVLGRILWPHTPGRAVALAGFSAFLPMHTALNAAIENDALAEALVIATVILCLRLLNDAPRCKWLYASLGTMLGLCFLAKTTAFVAFPIAITILLLPRRNNRLSSSHSWQSLAWIAVPAAILALPWLARNVLTYGIGDALGLARHDAIVMGQLRTSERIAQVGLAGLLREGTLTTFRSFWGVFGWMGVFMDERIYLALALVLLLALTGLTLWLWQNRSGLTNNRTRNIAVVVALWGLASLAGFLWYNLKFVQHQGRYLFPALPVWGMVITLGLESVKCHWRFYAVALTALAGMTLALGIISGDPHNIAVALLLAGAAALVVWHLGTRIYSAVACALPLAALWLLDVLGALFYVNRYL